MEPTSMVYISEFIGVRWVGGESQSESGSGNGKCSAHHENIMFVKIP